MKRSIPSRPVSFWRGLVLFYLVFLVVFFAATPFLTVLLYWEADLSTSILPELIGFCLQGAFLVLVFALYERRSSMAVRERHKMALSAYLAAFLGRLVTHGTGERMESDDDSSSLNPHLEKAAMKVLAEHGDKLATRVEGEAASMAVLVSVAVSIDQKHLHAWSDIVEALRQVAENVKGAQAEGASAQLMQAVRRFADLSLE
ncbi:MAG: hypothetical protein HQL53_04110 [Magnetococcales bacterium]|nr:hypothetical protein [Magnetococcales bacterium]